MPLKLFDFLVVPVYRSGGTAMQRFLSVHPKVNAVPKWTLDRYLANDREQELLEEAQGVMRDDFRLGLVQHSYIMEHHPLDSIAERLSKIVRKGGLIMVFRDHFDAMISGINHENIARYCGYKFEKAGLFWPKSVELRGDAAPLYDSAKSAPTEALVPPGKLAESAKFLPALRLERFRYAHIQETYERYFSTAQVFGYDSIFSADNRDSVARLFRGLGVEEPADDPFFRVRQAGRQMRFLEYNTMFVRTPYTSQLDVNLRPHTIHERAIDSRGEVIVNFRDDYAQTHFGDSLSLVDHAENNLSALGEEQGASLRRDVDAFLGQFFYPLWKKNYETVSRAIDGFHVPHLSPEEKTTMKVGLAEDAAAFFERNPDLSALWAENWEASNRWGRPSPGTRRAASR